MKIIFFDCETNGLPKNYKASVIDLENWPRVISLAWQVYDTVNNTVDSRHFLIKPDGWEIPGEKFWLDNGFHQKTSLEKGEPIKHALHEFITALNQVDLKVAHNLDFDNPVIGAEMLRAAVKPDKKVPGLCTMQSTIQLCKIPFANSKYGNKPGNYKFPKLAELQQVLFKTEMEGAHDALQDVQACAKCFFELVRTGVIKLPEIKA